MCLGGPRAAPGSCVTIFCCRGTQQTTWDFCVFLIGSLCRWHGGCALFATIPMCSAGTIYCLFYLSYRVYFSTSLYLSMSLSIYLSGFLSFCLSVCLSVYLFISLLFSYFCFDISTFIYSYEFSYIYSQYFLHRQ